MVYELALTNACTRHCDFCQIRQSSYVESRENVFKFIQMVKAKSGDQKFSISLFGGEPLVNTSAIELVVNMFKDLEQCSEISISTNGDLFESIASEPWVKHLRWCITAYDILKSHAKYQKMANTLEGLDVQFQYTFSDSDLEQSSEVVENLRSLGTKYKLAFSHSAKSWKTVNTVDLYSRVHGMTAGELEQCLDDFPSFRSLMIVNPLKKILAGVDMVEDHGLGCHCCIDTRIGCKEVFYHGKFVGPCLAFHMAGRDAREADKPLSKSCEECEYSSVCLRSCALELGESGKVDEKLCAIERAQLDAVCEFAMKHKYSRIWREIVKEYV